MYYKVKVGEIQYCIGGILKMMGDFIWYAGRAGYEKYVSFCFYYTIRQGIFIDLLGRIFFNIMGAVIERRVLEWRKR